MGEVVPSGKNLPEARNATLGQALFTAVIDHLAEQGVEQIPRSLIATSVKHGSQALKDGVDPEMVLIGCVLAIQKGTPQYTSHIIGDCVLTRAGKKMSRTEYEEMLGMINRGAQPAVQRFRETTEAIKNRKQIEKGGEK
jgi:hypothetical protein